MDYKISDSEWKVMEILWEKGAATQSEVMDALTEGWNKNTVYTFLSRLEHKGLVAAFVEEGRLTEKEKAMLKQLLEGMDV